MELTVCFVSLVENVLLKVLLVLHGGVKLSVVVLKQTGWMDIELIQRTCT